MRTTVTLDPDVHAMIRRAMKERDVSFKEALNDAVRAGQARPSTTFATTTHRMGRPAVPLAKALELAAAMEDEEIVRKLALGK